MLANPPAMFTCSNNGTAIVKNVMRFLIVGTRARSNVSCLDGSMCGEHSAVLCVKCACGWTMGSLASLFSLNMDHCFLVDDVCLTEERGREGQMTTVSPYKTFLDSPFLSVPGEMICNFVIVVFSFRHLHIHV